LFRHDPSRRKHHPTSALVVNQPFVLNMFSQKPKYAASAQLGQVADVVVDLLLCNQFVLGINSDLDVVPNPDTA
jgi:hypothetical protein